MSKQRQAGFTVIELILAIVVLAALAAFFAIQRNDLEVTARDQARKVAINAFYYDLTEVFYAENKYYPSTISRENLVAVDPALFTDPTGYTLAGSDCTYEDITGATATDGDCEYSYSTSDCNDKGECQSFTLTAIMESEDNYVKSPPAQK
jgi:prepilin-type N-terminal cleavage/methylation domain-containing protein